MSNQTAVPNVKSKNDKKEAAKIQAMMGQLREQNSQIISDETGNTCTLEVKGGEKREDGTIDLKSIPTVYFKNNKGGVYTVNHRVAKVFIDNCDDCTFILNGAIMTRIVEAWRCNNLILNSTCEIKTFQLDISKQVKINYKAPSEFGCIVWQGVEGSIDIGFTEKPELNYTTSFEKCKERWGDSELEIDQFIIRFVEELGEGLQEERCVRLKNGFLSTEREAAEWDKRNTLAAERYMNDFMKDGGIQLNKNTEKKIPPNSVCPKCDSGKKYKKCCMNKKALTGVAPGQKNATYNDVAKKN